MVLTTALTGAPSIWYDVCDPPGPGGETMGIMNCSAQGGPAFTSLPAFHAAATSGPSGGCTRTSKMCTHPMTW
jgi:hypothetical protein